MPKPRITFLKLILLMSTQYLNVCCKRVWIPPEASLTIEQRATRNGYPIESHQVITEDDYIITVYRIAHGLKKTENKSENKSAVLLIHGMIGSPDNFMLLGKERAAAYYFADKGLDVWLFAARGSYGAYKKKHKTFNWDKDPDYWSFSLDEIGVYDISATIDFIVNHTGQKKVSLIGHSAGGNELFCMFSEKPEYNEKVKVAINWGSAPILKYIDYPLIHLFSVLIDIFKAIAKNIGLVEGIPLLEKVVKPFLNTLCADSEWKKVCLMFASIIGSHKSVMQRPDDIHVLVSNMPRISIMQPLHFLENIRSGTFRRYDYGPRTNIKLYGQKHPPHYNLSAAKIPVAFFVGQNDGQGVIQDVYESMKQLPNVILVHEVPFPKFNHVDFVFGQNATEMIYEPTFKLINDIDNGIIPSPMKIPAKHLD